MFGANTLFMTPKGLVPLKKLKLFDKVLTPDGSFQPIVELGEWELVDRVVSTSTGDEIYCSKDVLWHIVHDAKFGTLVGDVNSTFWYTDELNGLGRAANIACLKSCKNSKSLFDPYEYGVTIPMSVPAAYMTAKTEIRLALLAGLIDSPICEVIKPDMAYFALYTKYPELAKGIITLCRTLCVGVDCRVDGDLWIIKISFNNNYAYLLPLRDPLKKPIKLSNSRRRIHFNKTRIVKKDYKKVYGRKVNVNGNFFVVGYGLLPVNTGLI